MYASTIKKIRIRIFLYQIYSCFVLGRGVGYILISSIFLYRVYSYITYSYSHSRDTKANRRIYKHSPDVLGDRPIQLKLAKNPQPIQEEELSELDESSESEPEEKPRRCPAGQRPPRAKANPLE